TCRTSCRRRAGDVDMGASMSATETETTASARRSMFTVARQIGVLGAVGLVAVLAVAGVTWRAGREVQQSTDRVETAGRMIRNPVEADMMQDALRADVLAGILSQGPADTEAVRADVAEHAAQLRAAIEANAALVEPGRVRDALDAVLPALEAYVAHAERLTSL